MARPAPIVTTDHMQRAYAQLRRPDWPSYEEMYRLFTQFSIVRARAVDIAHGRTLPPEPTGAPAPAPGRASARALGHTERRRRDDRALQVDLKCRAAGERDEQE